MSTESRVSLFLFVINAVGVSTYACRNGSDSSMDRWGGIEAGTLIVSCRTSAASLCSCPGDDNAIITVVIISSCDSNRGWEQGRLANKSCDKATVNKVRRRQPFTGSTGNMANSIRDLSWMLVNKAISVTTRTLKETHPGCCE